MKLARFWAGRGPELGVIVGDGVVSITRAMPALADDMSALIAGWSELEAKVRDLAARPTDPDLADVRLLAPVARPGKVFAIGLNYSDHIAETGAEAPKVQTWFTKAVTSINGPFDPVEIPFEPSRVDYEVELVAVIGAGGRRIAAADAAKAVFGWCVGNDVTERRWQMQSPQWSLGKSFDTHAPIGPWITTADEIADPHDLDVRCLVNGEARQSSNTRHLIFNVWAQIEHLSSAMTLQPGDLLFTGTPAGVGMAMKPPQFLQPGDVVRTEIEGLGALENACALGRIDAANR